MKKITVVVVIALVVITLLKLVHIDGGLVPGEPDGRNYVDVVRNFYHSPLPNYDGIIFFHSPPFYHYLSFLVSLVVGVNYLALRVVSLVAAFILGVVLYLYLKTKLSPWIAVLGSILFMITPFSVYYSRLGLIESLITLLVFSFVVTFEVAWLKNSFRWAFVSGICLGLALITKYSFLPLIGVIPLSFGLWGLGQIYQTRSLRFILTRVFLDKILLVVLVFGASLLIFVPVTYFNFQLNPHEFKSQLIEDFGLTKRKFEWSVFKLYLTSLPSFFSWPVVGLAFLGIFPLISKGIKNILPIVSILLVVYLLMAISVFQPRYVMLALPFIIVLATFGLDFIYRKVNLLKIKANYKKTATGLIFVVLFLAILPGSLLAVQASYHTTFAKVGEFIAVQNKNNQWVTSNYWPSGFVDQVGYKITWLSSLETDSDALSGGGQTKYVKITQDSFSMLPKEGGWVILEDLYSPTISNQTARKVPAQVIKSTLIPVKVFTDTSPNWPFFNTSINHISVYKFPKD